MSKAGDPPPATIAHEEVHVNIDKSSNGIAQYNASSFDVIVTQPGAPVVTQPDDRKKPKNFVVTSCFVTLLCNCIFGLLGYYFGVKANDAWQLGDEVASKHHAKKAKIFVILGILVGLATYALAFSLYFTIGTETHKVHNSGFTG